VVGLAHHVAQSRNLGDGHDVDLIAVADQFKVLVIQSRRQIHQNELVAQTQKLEGLGQRAGRDRPRRFSALRGRYQIEPAAVVEDEALQQLRIQTVGIFYQLIGVITVLGQTQVKSSVTEIVVQVEDEHPPRIRLRQQSTELGHDGGYAASALGPDECQNLGLGLLFFLPTPPSYPRYG